MPAQRSVTRWLERAPAPVFTAFAVIAAFATYFCMYAFPQAVRGRLLQGMVALPLLPALDLKSLCIIAQVLGYCASKFLGIKIVPEMPPERRALAILACIGVSEAALVLFGLTPAPYGALPGAERPAARHGLGARLRLPSRGAA